MALDAAVIALIRDEIGNDQDFTDTDLETIYIDTNRGNYNPLRTALIVWRRRRADYVKRGFDVSTAGTLNARRQRLQQLDKRVKELELLVDTTNRATAATMVPSAHREITSAEFS